MTNNSDLQTYEILPTVILETYFKNRIKSVSIYIL